MIPERKTIEDAPEPNRKLVEACLKSCRNYRTRMANSVQGPKVPSLREQMAQALLNAWDKIQELEQK